MIRLLPCTYEQVCQCACACCKSSNNKHTGKYRVLNRTPSHKQLNVACGCGVRCGVGITSIATVLASVKRALSDFGASTRAVIWTVSAVNNRVSRVLGCLSQLRSTDNDLQLMCAIELMQWQRVHIPSVQICAQSKIAWSWQLHLAPRAHLRTPSSQLVVRITKESPNLWQVSNTITVVGGGNAYAQLNWQTN